jgi:hypothetical protein
MISDNLSNTEVLALATQSIGKECYSNLNDLVVNFLSLTAKTVPRNNHTLKRWGSTIAEAFGKDNCVKKIIAFCKSDLFLYWVADNGGTKDHHSSDLTIYKEDYIIINAIWIIFQITTPIWDHLKSINHEITKEELLSLLYKTLYTPELEHTVLKLGNVITSRSNKILSTNADKYGIEVWEQHDITAQIIASVLLKVFKNYDPVNEPDRNVMVYISKVTDQIAKDTVGKLSEIHN